jgi:pilus assembly protein Flp/PilA
MMASGYERDINLKDPTIYQVVKDRRGVTAIEYALIAALIAVAAIAAFTLVGTDLSNTFTSIADQL